VIEDYQAKQVDLDASKTVYGQADRFFKDSLAKLNLEAKKSMDLLFRCSRHRGADVMECYFVEPATLVQHPNPFNEERRSSARLGEYGY
jgi:hypothetical protein